MEVGSLNVGFITGLPCTRRQHDSIWVIVNLVTKYAHLLDVKTINSAEDYAKLYINELVRLDRITLSVISDKGPQITSHFWKSFQKGLVLRYILVQHFIHTHMVR